MPINYETVSKRSTQIAEKAHEFLQRLQVPTEEQFTDPNFKRHLKVKTQIVNAKNNAEFEDHPKRPIKPLAPG